MFFCAVFLGKVEVFLALGILGICNHTSISYLQQHAAFHVDKNIFSQRYKTLDNCNH